MRVGDKYVINGQKVFISRTQHSDLLLLLARTTPYEELTDKTRGLSVFLVDLQEAVAKGQIVIQPLDIMFNHHTTQLFITDLEVPAENLIGREGEGFRHIIDGWNAERILVASQSVGDGHWFVEKRHQATPTSARSSAAPSAPTRACSSRSPSPTPASSPRRLMRDKAAWLFDHGKSCGAEANMAKLLASQAAWEAANACMDTHGGYGFVKEFDVERKFRETRLYMTAPVSNNMVLNFVSQNVLGLPRSY